jgi:hypothetical protein
MRLIAPTNWESTSQLSFTNNQFVQKEIFFTVDKKIFSKIDMMTAVYKEDQDVDPEAFIGVSGSGKRYASRRIRIIKTNAA